MELLNVELEQEVELQTSYELSGGIIPTGTINITTNGTHDVSSYADANVNVQGGITPTGTKEVTIDSAGTTTEDVTNYANVEITVPQGQYKPNIDARPTAPTITVSNGGLITAEVPTEFITDLLKPTFTEGYIESSDVSMTVKIGGSATKQMNTVNGQTVTPTTSQQNIAVQGDYVLGAINVAPIPDEYVIPTGTLSISQNGQGINVKDYEFVNVNVSGGAGHDMVIWLAFSGSGADRTSILIDARYHDVYYEIAYDSSSTYLVSGATANTNGLKIRDVYLYETESASTVYGYYQVDNQTISSSMRTTANSPWIYLDQEYKIAPHGYFIKFTISRSGSLMFSSNSNANNYVGANGIKVILKAI